MYAQPITFLVQVGGVLVVSLEVVALDVIPIVVLIISYSGVYLMCAQVGLVELLKSFGVVPHVVLGHSAGEVAAAYASGLLSLADSVKVSWSLPGGDCDDRSSSCSAEGSGGTAVVAIAAVV